MDVCDELGQEVLAQEFCDLYPDRAYEGQIRLEILTDVFFGCPCPLYC